MTKATTPIDTDTRTSWTDRLVSMSVNQDMLITFKAVASARHAIWKISNTSGMRFSSKKQGPTYLITRVA